MTAPPKPPKETDPSPEDDSKCVVWAIYIVGVIFILFCLFMFLESSRVSE